MAKTIGKNPNRYIDNSMRDFAQQPLNLKKSSVRKSQAKPFDVVRTGWHLGRQAAGGHWSGFLCSKGEIRLEGSGGQVGEHRLQFGAAEQALGGERKAKSQP